MKHQTYYICEYGTIRRRDDYDVNAYTNSLSELYLDTAGFNSLYNFILENQDESGEFGKLFSLFQKGSKQQIKVKNYVGVIETLDGLHLEILPKIHVSATEYQNALSETKSIFLRMLRHLKDCPFVGMSTAHLNSQLDFPILEVFINSFVLETEALLNQYIKSDYIAREENLPYLRGKLLVNQNIKFNRINKSHFFCEHTEFSLNIPANRLIKSTLLKLFSVSKSYSNIYSINRLLTHFEEVDVSRNITADFKSTRTANRLMSRYEKILGWCEVFLSNRSFTNFKGSSLNTAILFPMERIFEDYITDLFKSNSLGFRVRAQDKSYFLVQHKNEGRFRIKPDMVADKENEDKVFIIDAKWKLINQNQEKRNYDISQADMYQLYAYGKKYCKNGKDPGLVLLYPENTNFTGKLDRFIYEGELQLEVVPFCFSEKSDRQTVEKILRELIS